MMKTEFLQDGTTSWMPRVRWLALTVVVLILVTPVFALDDQASWESLSDQQRRVLSAMNKESGWSDLALERRQRLAKGAERWASMTPRQKKRARKRFAQWNKMSAARKKRLRKRYREFQKLSPEEKQRVRKNLKYYRSLPLAQRRELQRQFRTMTPEQRRERATQTDIRRPRKRNR